MKLGKGIHKRYGRPKGSKNNTARCVKCGSSDRVKFDLDSSSVLCIYCRNPERKRPTEKARPVGRPKGYSPAKIKAAAEKERIIKKSEDIKIEKAVVEATERAKFEKTLREIDIHPIEKFAAIYMNHYWKCAVPPFHREIYKYLGSDISRLVIEAPRDFAKSTIVSVIYPMYLICETKTEDILSFSRSIDLAKKWVGRIRREIESNMLIKYYYGLRKGEMWAKDKIVIRRPDGSECTLTAFGKGSSARGQRGIIFIDDPQDKGDVKSQTVLESDQDWFFEDVINILEPDQSLRFIGTRLSPLSLLSSAAKLPGWTHLSYKAINEKGESIWPEKWPIEALNKRRDEIGVDRFNSEFMNEPVISGNPIFRSEWFRFYEPKGETFLKDKRNGLFIITAIDPAISKRETASFTGIVTIGATLEKKPRFYILDVRHGHWSMEDTWKQLLMVNDRFQQNRTLVETVAYQQALFEFLTNQETIYHRYMGLMEIKPDKDKVRRSWAVQGLFQTGRVFFDFNDKEHQKLMNELVMFTGDQTYADDLVDAMDYALRELGGWSETSQIQDNWVADNTRPVGVDTFTGW